VDFRSAGFTLVRMVMRVPHRLSVCSLVFLAVSAPAQEYSSRAQRQLLAATNREREARGLPALKWNESLAEAARRHDQVMVEHQTISHDFPGEPSLPTRATRAGVHFSALAENVAEAPDPTQIHSLWMNSPGHRANILDRDMDSIGIAVAERNGEFYAVEDFAKVK
jgi:uncharacterized protein YkwD